MVAMTAKLAQLPGGPDPAEPVPRAPVDGFDLHAFAAVAAELAAREAPRAAVLARAGLTEMRWTAIETTWMLRLATSLLQGDLSLHAEHDEAFSAAQRAIQRRRA
jgi:hypothetical protein